MLIATKVYRPDTLSIASWDVSDDTVARKWWDWAKDLQMNGRNEADQLRNRAILRNGKFHVIATKRRGYIVLEAYQ